MKRRKSGRKNFPSHSLLVWSVTDEVIESSVIRGAQFLDILNAGFGGVMAFVRCSRYSWDDAEAGHALSHIRQLCRSNGMECWIVPDPRQVSHRLLESRLGLEILLFGNAPRPSVLPNTGPVVHGKFSVRCDLSPRHVHTLTDVAVEFVPLGLEKVFAVRRGEESLGRREVVDITHRAKLFYNARDRYVEAFGHWDGPGAGEWKVLAFFRVRTNHVDFSDQSQIRRYEEKLAALKRAAGRVNGVAWDEPGFTCVYGALPYSRNIRDRYAVIRGREIGSDLWKIALEAIDGSHIPVREAYYGAVSESLREAERRFAVTSRRLWGAGLVVGIHDTWHFESADMCDMTHGSLDLWESAGLKSGGFVDLGGIQQCADPDSPYYANLAALSVIAASLGKLSPGKYAYNNLWTIGDDEGDGSQQRAMGHAVRIMGLFGTRWLAHAYGPAGTIGAEATFLGSPPLPGYPRHSTWGGFARWNAQLKRQCELAENRLPSANLLLLFPVETMYALGDPRADHAAASIFRLVRDLLDNRYQIDVIGSTRAGTGVWKDGEFRLAGQRYRSILFPYPAVVGTSLLKLLKERSERVLYAFGRPEMTAHGKRIRPADDEIALSVEEVLVRLAREDILRPVASPPGTWVTLTEVSSGTLVGVAPSRVSRQVSGEVSFDGQGVTLPPAETLRRILFRPGRSPQILDEGPAVGGES